MPNAFTNFCPDADDLLRRVSRHVDDALLHEIAAADYGYGLQENLVALRQIRDGAWPGARMDWHPREVLQLTRWVEPEAPNSKRGFSREREHWKRAFACSALLRAAGEPGSRELRDGWNQTLIQLIDSLQSIAPELYGPAAAFLAWLIHRAEADDYTEELGFFLVALLSFALQLGATDDVILALSELTSGEVAREVEGNAWLRPSARWLLDTTSHNQLHGSWERLGLSLHEIDLRGRSSAARDWVRLIGSELAGK